MNSEKNYKKNPQKLLKMSKVVISWKISMKGQIEVKHVKLGNIL